MGGVGSHLVRMLVQRGERVRVLDNGFSGTPQRIADVLRDGERIDGDVRDAAIARRALEGVEVVLHHVAGASVWRSVAEPMMARATNVIGTLDILRAAREAGVRRLVFASSSAVSGNLPITPKARVFQFNRTLHMGCKSSLRSPIAGYGMLSMD